MLKRCARLLFVAAVVLVGVGAPDADSANLNQLLRGDYAFSGEATCLVSRGGFNTNLTPLGPPAPFPFVISFSVQGVRTFNGDGTGKVVAHVISMSHPFTVPSQFVSPYTPFFNRGGAGSADVEADFTYDVAPDMTVTLENVTVTGTIQTGSSAGQTFTITNFPTSSGRISQDHRTLTLAHVDPAVETQTFSGGDVQYRICHRSRILLEQKGGS